MAKPDAQEDAQQKGVKGGSLADLPKGKGLPPVHLWNPPYCGEMDLRILRDGTWLHDGTPIGRAALVRLFSTILKREGDKYFLVTPVEKLGIMVEDVPFIAVDLDESGTGPDQQVGLTTNVGDHITLGPDNPLRVVIAPDGSPAPYAMVRAGLEARLDRKSFYRLAALGTIEVYDDADWFGIWSSGVFFAIQPAADLGMATG
jgi:hypothetical protein